MSCLREEYPSETPESLCALFGHTKQAYYQKRMYEYKDKVEEDIVLEIVRDIRKDCPGVGTRKLHWMLKETYGQKFGRDQLFALLDREQMLLRQRHRHPKTTDSNHSLKKWPNLVKAMVPTRPNQVWVSDITYVKVDGETMYLFLITDMYSRKIVGWVFSDNMEAENAIIALKMAIRQRKGKGLPTIHHSDRGSQYCSTKYVNLLKKHGIDISMTESGDPRDNAYAERVNGTIKNEFLRSLNPSKDNVAEMVKSSITTYNERRPHASIAYLTPSVAHTMEGEIERMWKKYPWYSKGKSGFFTNFVDPNEGEASVERREPEIDGASSPAQSLPQLQAQRTDTGALESPDRTPLQLVNVVKDI